jgi:hypothetical protein
MEDKIDILIIDEGNINYHLERGVIEHTYFLDGDREYATCQCGRVLWMTTIERVNKL